MPRPLDLLGRVLWRPRQLGRVLSRPRQLDQQPRRVLWGLPPRRVLWGLPPRQLRWGLRGQSGRLWTFQNPKPQPF